MNGVEIRESLGLRDWEKAQQRIRDWEAAGKQTQEVEPITVEQACEEFQLDARARKLRKATLDKYRLLLDGPKKKDNENVKDADPPSPGLKEFSRTQGIRFLKELDLNQLRKFRALWRDGNFAALKKLGRLIALFAFAQESGWVADNPARNIKKPKITVPPTLPFSQQEMIAILAACAQLAEPSARRVRALVLLLRYSGMRIGDGATCPVDRLTGDRLFLYTQKTGVPVNVKLPPFVVEALQTMQKISSQYFFWTGEGSKETVAGNWRRTLRGVFESARIVHGHPHRFRDTFAVELLLDGVPLERVSVLLGHSSIRVTEKHDAPWIRAWQEQLEADLERSWAHDPIVFAETKGTPEVHRKREAVN